eukprot:TRINITY_DN12078_c0_g1_i1.p1 TRINITY_DN12078_c0_g1~~TRINITY_DN12078_c0_g1_i1.p1  ORF type:complete len:287 (+),score=40.21 TRINITY_DN12078_c0_g1_i1:159-1019(+)
MALAVRADPGMYMYPLHRCKVVYLVRHGQGFHNVAGELDHQQYQSEEHFDASLTGQGWKQVAALRKHVQEMGILDSLELVVTSPLTRTMQTASGVFGGGDLESDNSEPPLMAEGVGKAKRAAISSVSSPPFVAVEWCREHLGVHPCDKRQTVREYRNLFPAIDFSEVETDKDTWWKADVRETDDELYARARNLIRWLSERKQTRIAVVTHSSFLNHLVRLFGEGCAPVVKKELTGPFQNCEMRCVVLAQATEASNGSSLNYSGGSPSGPAAGSDLADEKKHDNGQL